jgi:predicted phage terminase large subunit-like protein
LSFTQTLDAVRHVTGLFPQSRRKIIEGKANGDAVIDSLRHEIPGIVVFEPGRDSKEGRATAVSPYIRAGNVHLPTTRVASMAPEISFDVEAFILEATAFGHGAAHDDQVDATSQYLIEAYLVGGKATFSAPKGMIPRYRGRTDKVTRATTPAFSPIQQRFADGQRRHWGQQALPPFQQRLTDRQRHRREV